MNDFAQIRGECSSCPSGGLPVLTAPPFSVQLYQLFPLLPRYEGAQEDLGCIYSPGSLCCCLLHPSEGMGGREGGREGIRRKEWRKRRKKGVRKREGKKGRREKGEVEELPRVYK